MNSAKKRFTALIFGMGVDFMVFIKEHKMIQKCIIQREMPNKILAADGDFR